MLSLEALKMSRNKIILILLCLVCCSFQSAYTQEVNSTIAPIQDLKEVQTTIRGHIQNAFKGRKAELRFHTDLISLDEHLFQVPVGSDELFAMTFLLAKPTVATFTYYGLEVQIYVEPGNDLQIDFDALDFWGTLRFLGTGAVHNAYLLSSTKKFQQWTTQSISYEIVQRQAMDYRRLLDRLKDQKQEFLNKFGGKNEFSVDFLSYAQSDINYWWGYQLLRYRIEHPLANGLTSPMILPKAYYLFLNHLLVSNDEALSNRNYLYFLDQYLSFRNENPVEYNGPDFLANSVKITTSSMLVLSEADKPPILTELKKGQRAIYMNERSEFKSKILIGEALHEDYWYKIRTTDGIEGWVIGVGSKLDKLKAGPLVANEKGKEVYRNADKILVGKALTYILASDLYWRSHLETPEELAADVEDFLAKNDDPVFRDIIKAAYTEAERRSKKNKEVIYGATNYLTVRRPQILSREGEEVKKVTPIVSKVIIKSTDLPGSENKQEDLTIIASTSKVKKKKRRKDKIARSKNKKSKKEIANKNEVAKSEKKPKEIVLDKTEIPVEETELVQKEKEPELIADPKTELPAKTPLSESKEPTKSVADATPVTKLAPPNPTTVTPTTVPPTPSHNRTTANKYVEIATPIAVTDAPQIKKIKIKGTSIFSKGLKLVLLEDPILLLEQEVKLKGANSSTMEGTISLVANQNAYLEYGQERIDLFFQNAAGDLQVTFNPSDFPASVKFSGEGASANNYLLALALLKKKSETNLKKYIREAEPLTFISFMEEQRKSLLSFFKEYKKQNKIDRLFQEYAKADIEYWYGYQMLNYPWEHPLYKNQNAPMAVPDSYYSFFEELVISNEFALPNLNYIYFLDEFMNYQSNLLSNEHLSNKDLAKKFLKGDPFDYYMTKLLSIDCKRGKALQVGPEIQAFIASCDNQTYNNVLRQVYNEAKGLSTGDNAPLFTLRDINGKEVQLSEFRGKVVYLDFWATWCSPCVMQLRNSKQWKSEFNNREDMVFLYVSLDKDINAWKSFVRGQGLLGEHLKADGGDVYKSKIARIYKVKRMPHVYLLDKNGKVAYNSATDSKSGRVIDYIRKLLQD